MLKMSITDAAAKLGVSKEAIHNRIRRGSLQSVVENGVKFVMLENTEQKYSTRKPSIKRGLQNNEKYYQFLEEQNKKLQNKIEALEGETKTLREQKEQMLIEERFRIEKIYKDKDEQLKNILNAISQKFLPGNTLAEDTVDDLVEAEIQSQPLIEQNRKNEKDKKQTKPVALKKYLKKLDISEKKYKKIQKKIKKAAKKDKRVLLLDRKLYIYPQRYNYDDLIPAKTTKKH